MLLFPYTHNHADGDLTLVGHRVVGAFSGYEFEYALDNKLLRALLPDEATCETVTFDEGIDAPSNFIQPVSAGRDQGSGSRSSPDFGPLAGGPPGQSHQGVG